MPEHAVRPAAAAARRRLVLERVPHRCGLSRRQQVLCGRLQLRLRAARRTHHRGAGHRGAGHRAVGASAATTDRALSGRHGSAVGAEATGGGERCAGRGCRGDAALLCDRVPVAHGHVALRCGDCEWNRKQPIWLGNITIFRLCS